MRHDTSTASCRARAGTLFLGAVLALAACGGSGSSGGSTAAFDVTSEADALLHMDELRAAGFTGQGVRVGVISTGVVNLASYQAAGRLPQSLYVTDNTPGTLDEGSWMLELVHQHAPDAVLGFCDGIDLDFDSCISDLVSNFHADVVVDDILFAGQFYPDATADVVTRLQAANDRLVYIHLAGNEQNGGYWQGAFIPVTGTLLSGSATLLDFGAASGSASQGYNEVSVPAGKRLSVFLSWNDAPHGVANHALSAYLLDEGGGELSHASAQAEPNLRVDYSNTGGAPQRVRLVVTLDGGAAAGLVLQFSEGSQTCNIECQPFTFASSGLAGGTVGDFDDALVVGAVNAQTPDTLEAWTNHGPFRLDFSASADSSSPDGYDYTRLAAPLLLAKPDLVSVDCVTVPFSDGTTLANKRFCGTSAAVPSIAAAAALLESAGFDRARVLKALRGTARPLGAATWDPGYGFGLADVAAAWHSGGP